MRISRTALLTALTVTALCGAVTSAGLTANAADAPPAPVASSTANPNAGGELPVGNVYIVLEPSATTPSKLVSTTYCWTGAEIDPCSRVVYGTVTLDSKLASVQISTTTGSDATEQIVSDKSALCYASVRQTACIGEYDGHPVSRHITINKGGVALVLAQITLNRSDLPVPSNGNAAAKVQSFIAQHHQQALQAAASGSFAG